MQGVTAAVRIDPASGAAVLAGPGSFGSFECSIEPDVEAKRDLLGEW